VIAHDGTVVEDEVRVIVRASRRRRGEDAQAAGHAEMHEQRPVADREQQIFAAPIDALDGATLQQPCESARNRPAQAAVVHPQRSDAPADHARRDAAACRLDLGQLGHCERMDA